MHNGLERILAVAEPADTDELTMAVAARDAAMRRYKDTATKEAGADYAASRTLLAEAVSRMAAKYFPAESPGAGGERFKNKRQALEWLNSQGYNVSNGKFYADCAKGFPPVHRDGTVSRWQVMEYAQRVNKERAIQAADIEASGEKERLEIEKLRLEVERRRVENRKEDARWMQADDAWAAVAALIGVIRDSLRHHLNVSAAKLAMLAGGDQARAPEVFEGCEEAVSAAFNEIARQGRLDGMFERHAD